MKELIVKNLNEELKIKVDTTDEGAIVFVYLNETELRFDKYGAHFSGITGEMSQKSEENITKLLEDLGYSVRIWTGKRVNSESAFVCSIVGGKPAKEKFVKIYLRGSSNINPYKIMNDIVKGCNVKEVETF